MSVSTVQHWMLGGLAAKSITISSHNEGPDSLYLAAKLDIYGENGGCDASITFSGSPAEILGFLETLRAQVEREHREAEREQCPNCSLMRGCSQPHARRDEP